jgi:hypothetical protein
LTAQVQGLGGSITVVISSQTGGPLGFTRPGISKFVNPKHSVTINPGYERIVLFPVSISKILGLQGADIVFVPRWAAEQALNPAREPDEPYSEAFKQRSAWETLPTNTLLFCSLLSQRKLLMLSTHDLVAHMAGLHESMWPEIQVFASWIGGCLSRYFAAIRRASVETLILPLIAGTLLDIYAQPLSRGYARQLRVLIEMITVYLDTHGAVLAERAVPRLEIFPREFAAFMALFRSNQDSEFIRQQGLALLDAIAVQTTTGGSRKEHER